jgi:hypothetical protein
MTTQQEEQILRKIKIDYEYQNTEDIHEQDNIPNPFEDLTMEELLYLRQHKQLLLKNN